MRVPNRRKPLGMAVAGREDSEPADALAKRCGLSRIQERTLRAAVAQAVAFRDANPATFDNLYGRGLVYWPDAPAATGWFRATPTGEAVIRQLDTLRAAVATGR